MSQPSKQQQLKAFDEARHRKEEAEKVFSATTMTTLQNRRHKILRRRRLFAGSSSVGRQPFEGRCPLRRRGSSSSRRLLRLRPLVCQSPLRPFRLRPLRRLRLAEGTTTPRPRTRTISTRRTTTMTVASMRTLFLHHHPRLHLLPPPPPQEGASLLLVRTLARSVEECSVGIPVAPVEAATKRLSPSAAVTVAAAAELAGVSSTHAASTRTSRFRRC